MSARQRQQARPRNRRTQSTWKSYALPAVGAAAVLLVVGLIAVILASGGDDGGDEDEGLAVADDTPTPTLAPEGDDEAEDEAENTPTPTQAPVDEESPEGTPTPQPATEEQSDSTPTPAPEPTPEPEPTPQPLVGDFGELPPGDMPSGSPADALNLEYRLDMSLQALPTEATTYRVQRREWTGEQFQTLVDQLGIDGEVVDQGNGSFQAEGSSASVYVNNTVVQFIRSETGESSDELPENEQLTQMARNWLTENGIAGADIGQGQVLNRNEASGQAFVQIKPVEPPNIISATPSAGITIRGDGVVTEAMINWPESLQASNYGLRSAEELWNAASQGRGFVDIDVNNLPPDFQGSSGTVTVTNASIAYTIAGSQQGEQYLVPVAVFSGTTTLEGSDAAIPVDIYVEAVSAQASPRG